MIPQCLAVIQFPDTRRKSDTCWSYQRTNASYYWSR